MRENGQLTYVQPTTLPDTTWPEGPGLSKKRIRQVGTAPSWTRLDVLPTSQLFSSACVDDIEVVGQKKTT